MVEPAGDFPGDFQMRKLIFTHWNIIRHIKEDICSLKHGIAQETMGGDILAFLFPELVHLPLIGRDPFQPG